MQSVLQKLKETKEALEALKELRIALNSNITDANSDLCGDFLLSDGAFSRFEQVIEAYYVQQSIFKSHLEMNALSFETDNLTEISTELDHMISEIELEIIEAKRLEEEAFRRQKEAEEQALKAMEEVLQEGDESELSDEEDGTEEEMLQIPTSTAPIENAAPVSSIPYEAVPMEQLVIPYEPLLPFENYGKMVTKSGRVATFKKDISTGIRKQISLLIMAYLSEYHVLSAQTAFVYIYPIAQNIVGGAADLCSVSDVRSCCELLTRKGYLFGYSGTCPDGATTTFYTLSPMGMDILHSDTGYYLLSGTGIQLNQGAFVPQVTGYAEYLKNALLCRVNDALYLAQPPLPLYYSQFDICTPFEYFLFPQNAPCYLIPMLATEQSAIDSYYPLLSQLTGQPASLIALVVNDLNYTNSWISLWHNLTQGAYANTTVLCCDYYGRLSDGSMLYERLMQLSGFCPQSDAPIVENTPQENL